MSLWADCLTLTNGVWDGGAACYYFPLFTGGAGDARLPRTFLVRVRFPLALLAHRIVVKLAAEQHALAFGTLGAGFTLLWQFVHVVAVVAHAGGIAGFCAGRFHAEQTCAHCAGLTTLCVTKVFWEGFTWKEGNIEWTFIFNLHKENFIYFEKRMSPFGWKRHNDTLKSLSQHFYRKITQGPNVCILSILAFISDINVYMYEYIYIDEYRLYMLILISNAFLL